MARAMTIVAQLSQGEISLNAAGTGIDQMNPMTVSTMAGTQMMCSSSLRGLLWLSPYSPNHCSTVRMARKATPAPIPKQERALQECATKQGMPGSPHAADAANHEVCRRQRDPSRCEPVRALSAIHAHAHQGAGNLGPLAERPDTAAAQCAVAQSRRRDVWRLPGSAGGSHRRTGMCASLPGIFGLDPRHGDIIRPWR